MKKFVLFLVCAFIISPSFAADVDFNTDLWDNYNNDEIINNAKETQFVTDEDFEEAIQKIDSKVNKWKNWAERRKKPKGEEFSQSNETELINDEHGEDSSLPVISLPVELKIGDGIIPVGHYQIQGEMVDGRPILSLYQAHYLVAKIPAIETNDDFDKEEILFADWLSDEDNPDRIKLIYGSLDFNAYTYVNLANQY
ncbi:hypothetical protein IJ596_02350 [bacterium]|nr:hypothetical protein [bacterium]